MGNVSSKTTDFVTILYITFIYDSVGKLLLSTKENQTALNLKSDRKDLWQEVHEPYRSPE